MSKLDNPLKKRLEEEKYLNAVSYVRREAQSIKKLSSNELAHLNQMLTSNEDPWRAEPVHITIPSGETHHFNIIANPQNTARELIGAALDMLSNGDAVSASFYLYSHLVREHLFVDANRRTAVLALIWLLTSKGIDIDPQSLLQRPLGNLRDPAALNALKLELTEIINSPI